MKSWTSPAFRAPDATPGKDCKSFEGGQVVTTEKFGGNSGKKKNTEKHTRQLVFATKTHTKKHKKHTRQLVFATKKRMRQPGKAYAATCICY